MNQATAFGIFCELRRALVEAGVASQTKQADMFYILSQEQHTKSFHDSSLCAFGILTDAAEAAKHSPQVGLSFEKHDLDSSK